MEWIWIRGWIGQFGLGMWRAFGLYKMALWLCWRFWGDFDVEDIRKYTFFETNLFFLEVSGLGNPHLVHVFETLGYSPVLVWLKGRNRVCEWVIIDDCAGGNMIYSFALVSRVSVLLEGDETMDG